MFSTSPARRGVRKDGSRFWGSGVMERVVDDTGCVVGLAKILREPGAASN